MPKINRTEAQVAAHQFQAELFYTFASETVSPVYWYAEHVGVFWTDPKTLPQLDELDGHPVKGPFNTKEEAEIDMSLPAWDASLCNCPAGNSPCAYCESGNYRID